MAHIPPYLLLCFSLLITLLYGSLRNHYSKKYAQNHADFYLLNGLSSLFSCLSLLALSGAIPTPSGYTILLGILFGVVTMFSAFFTMLALRFGPLSYTTVIISSSMILPALSGAFFWNEPVGIGQVVGIALIVVTLFLSVDHKGYDRGFSLKWLLCCLGAFLCSGSIGILQKMHQSSVHKGELSFFLLEAFFVSAVLSAVFYFVTRRRLLGRGDPIRKIPAKTMLVIAAVSGICIGLANLLNLYLSGALPSVIFFPIVNGANVVLSIFVSVAIFRETLTKRQWLGLALGVVAAFLLCNVFAGGRLWQE